MKRSICSPSRPTGHKTCQALVSVSWRFSNGEISATRLVPGFGAAYFKLLAIGVVSPWASDALAQGHAATLQTNNDSPSTAEQPNAKTLLRSREPPAEDAERRRKSSPPERIRSSRHRGCALLALSLRLGSWRQIEGAVAFHEAIGTVAISPVLAAAWLVHLRAQS